MMEYYNNPVATLTNRKMELPVMTLPARLGRNNNVVEVYLFHESVSREHCVFECINRRFTVKDLGSTMGTFINGVRLEPNVAYNIEDGAKIQFGKVKMVFHADYQALAEWERMQAPVRTAPAPEETAGPAGNSGNKNISIRVREMSDFEYDEDEVVYLDCGLKPEEKSLSYTSEIRKKELEAGIAADIAESSPADDIKNTQVVEFDEAEAAEEAPAEELADEVVEEAPAEELADAVVEEAPAEPAFAPASEIAEEEGTFEEPAAEEPSSPEDPAEVPEKEKVLRLTWIDDTTGETRKVNIDRFPFRIGRKSDANDYSIARNGVSRRHMHFEEADGEIYIIDDASTNGVRLNGNKIDPEERVKLSSGDSIRIVGITFAVEIE